MPANRNALIRYKTLDQCLQNRYRKWTLEDLIEACSEVLYEYEGIDKGVSRRTVQADIQTMRSDKLGYNAPIVVVDRKFYTYEDPDYSITNLPLTDQDLEKLGEAVEFMKEFAGFSHFRELGGMVQKLEGHIYAQKNQTRSVIDFEKNENLRGLEHLDGLYQAIIAQKELEITYQSFKARKPGSFIFHPYLLKEFRNRWFVLGKRLGGGQHMLNLALDRIQSVATREMEFEVPEDFPGADYFKEVIGVTVKPTMESEEVVLLLNKQHAPYILTKPLHPSQKVLNEDETGVTISIVVQHNFELEKELLSYSDQLKVLSPPGLVRRIQKRLRDSVGLYGEV